MPELSQTAGAPAQVFSLHPPVWLRTPPATAMAEDPAVASEFERHPQFHLAIERHALGQIAFMESLPPALQALPHDQASNALIVACIVLDSLPEGLRARTLVRAAQRARLCSRARTLYFFHRLIELGYAVVDAGAPGWTRSRVALTAEFKAAFEPARLPIFDVLATLDPSLAGAPALARDPRLARRFLLALAAVLEARGPQLTRRDRPMLIFQSRDGGMRILNDILAAQRPRRGQLLEPVRLSYSSMARRNGISRRHVGRLFQDAEAGGLLRRDGHVHYFSRRLSEDVERYYSAGFDLARTAAHVAGFAAPTLSRPAP